MKNYLAYINGHMVDNIKKVEIYSPACNQKVLGTVPALSKEQIDSAFNAAAEGFLTWSQTTPDVRAKWMLQFAEKLKYKADEIAKLMVDEIAKNYSEAKTEVLRSVDYIIETVHAYYDLIEHPQIFSSADHHEIPKDKVAVYKRKPLGVALTISPFNYPINLMVAKIVPALITGNTVVHKSATQGSLVGAIVAEIFANLKVGNKKFPAGVFNFVSGRGSEIGSHLLTNVKINVASFTGSTAIGKQLALHMAMKPYVLELGGKDAALVLDDADLMKTVKEIVKGAYSYSGQRCTAIKRIFVSDKMVEKLLPLLIDAIKKLTVGFASEGCQITHLIDKNAVALVKHLYDDAVNKGAKSLLGEYRAENNLVYPILLDHVTPEMEIAWTEPFGPIIPILRYRNVEEAIQLINKSIYGLQSSIFSENYKKANELAFQIETGTVNINRASSRGPDILPFLGIKDSGFGEQGIVSALKSFTRIQGLILNDQSEFLN